jgi:chromosome transmission fidelity protein 4
LLLPRRALSEFGAHRQGSYFGSRPQLLFFLSNLVDQIRRQSASDTSILITSLSFSPTQNLLAWTDTDGVFSRWVEPVLSPSPSPFKTSPVTPVNHSAEELFGDNKEGDVGGDLSVDMPDDDWIIDDVGILDEEEEGRDKHLGGGLVKEMGRLDLSSFKAELQRNDSYLSVSITKAQPPFQPGSTPMVGKKRYLGLSLSPSPSPLLWSLILWCVRASVQHNRRDRRHRPGYSPHRERRVSRSQCEEGLSFHRSFQV